MNKAITSVILTLLLVCPLAKALTGCAGYPNQPERYGVLLYAGRITNSTLGQVVGMNFTLDEEKLYSIELTRTFAGDGPVRRYFGPMFQRFWLNFNVTYHDDPFKGNIYEFAPFISGHWRILNWHRKLQIHFAVGEGISYVTKVPMREFRNSDSPKKVLNYLMFEFSFTSPQCPQLELVARIHHRSGVFGLYNANNSGSTAVGLAVRYFFWEAS